MTGAALVVWYYQLPFLVLVMLSSVQEPISQAVVAF